MKVICTTNWATAEQIDTFGLDPRVGHSYYITPGRTYTVLALTMEPVAGNWGAGVTLDILDDFDRWSTKPLFLFEIVDPRLSKHWIAHKYPDSGLTLWPESFYSPYYHDKLTDGDPEIVEDFRRVCNILEAEFAAAD